MPLLLARRLCFGNVFDAQNRHPGAISHRPAGFHGVPGIHKTLPGNRWPAPALDTLPPLLVRRCGGALGAGRGGIGFWLFFISLSVHGGPFFVSPSGPSLLGPHLLCHGLTITRFGKIQRAIRDSENRVLFSGYATTNFKLFVFVLSAIIAGLGGALFVPQAGIINPSEMATDKSLEAVVWVAVGGRGTLVGPIIGAVVVNWLKSFATHSAPEYWLYILGGLFIVMTLFFPKGIVGIPEQYRAFRQRRAPAAD